MKKNLTQINISFLLSGKHPMAKKYAGKHVLVIEDKVFPLKESKEEILIDMEKLAKKYGKPPTVVFIPRRDISYILFL